MKLLEYMAAGRAVVAPRLASIADIVTDGDTGVLFTRGDAQDLSAVLRRLGESENLRNDLGRRARSVIERERNWKRIAERVLEELAAAR
jgi:glycosyltransferase involved in cell wall biosynthesis